MSDDKSEKLRIIRDAVFNLEGSELADLRREGGYFPVIGEGNHNARIMFVGEAPGANEAKTGRPFVGQAGKVLEELLNTVGLKREDIYITNVVKDRPPQNRDPRKKEVALYAPFLNQQIEIIQPKVIVPLGRFAMEHILTYFDSPAKTQKITELRATKIAVQASYGQVLVIPLMHPAVSLHVPQFKEGLYTDFLVLKEFVEQ